MSVLSNEALSTSTMLTRRPTLKTSGSDAICTSKILKSPIVWNGGSSFAWISDDQHKKVYKLETRGSLKMSDTLYALIELEDQYVSIISVSTICQPRKWRRGIHTGKIQRISLHNSHCRHQPYVRSRAIHEFAKWPS